MKIATYPEIGWMKERFQVLTLNEQTCEFDWFAEPGVSVPRHLHKDSDEHFAVLEGELTFTIENEILILEAGEEITVEKMQMHNISNKTKAVTKCRVSFHPVADQGKFFEVFHFLVKQNPAYKNALFKAMYIAKEMGYKEFSTVNGAMKVMESIMFASFKVIAPLAGWNTLLEKYRNENG